MTTGFGAPAGTEGDGLNPLFDRLIQLTTLSCLVYMGVVWLIGGEPARLVAPAVIAAGGPFCNMLRNRVGQRLGFTVYVWSIWLAIMVQSTIRGGTLNPILHGSLVLVLMGGWLLGLRQAFWLLVASVTWIAALTWSTHIGWWLPDPMAAGLGHWLAMTSVWLVGYLVLRQVLRTHENNLAEVRALNSSLLGKVQELAQQERATRFTEQKVSQLLMASPLPITVASYNRGVYVDVNPAWERFFKYQKEDVLGKTSVDLGFWRDLGQRQGWIDRLAADGRVSGYEVTFQMRDGTPRSFMLSSERFFYGEEDCVLTMSVDVTERKRLESELKELNTGLEQRVVERTRELDDSNQELTRTMSRLKHTQDELLQSEKLASLGSLVAGVAHELNTPLGNALVTSRTLSKEVKDMLDAVALGELKKSAFQSFLSRIAEGALLTERSLERAVMLIASFKQVAVDQVSERRRSFDLAQALREVVETLRPNIKRLSLRLELELPVNLTMDSFPGPLGQVVINLVTNSVTHAFDGRTNGIIRVRAFQHGADVVRVIVEDNGSGISGEHLGQIFDPFFTTKLGRGGSGLGLSISHRIVTKVLGGQINVQTPPQGGAVFELTLPMTAPSVVN
jgi:PAS domain S-box-containing protein